MVFHLYQDVVGNWRWYLAAPNGVKLAVSPVAANGAPQPAQKFPPVKFLEWVKTQLAMADAVHSCYEAGPFGYVLHRELVKLGVHNLVVQPVCLDEQHKGVNHDKSDARQLALRLDRSTWPATITPWPPRACPRPRRSSGASKAASANCSSGRSNAWPRKAGACS